MQCNSFEMQFWMVYVCIKYKTWMCVQSAIAQPKHSLTCSESGGVVGEMVKYKRNLERIDDEGVFTAH
jgi:hypothetical protein